MATPTVTVRRTPVSFTVDASNDWVFTLDCGHQVTVAALSSLMAGTQLDCATCDALVVNKQAIP